MAIPLGLFMLRVAEEIRANTLIQSTIENDLEPVRDNSIVSFDANWGPQDDLAILATFRPRAR